MTISVGIEALNIFAGTAALNVGLLAAHRNLNSQRFANLMMHEKTVPLPFEDPVTLGATAARPLVDALSADERKRIELLITCSESGLDFSKSISTYIHHYLGLSRNCRMFEIKQACYSGTAGLQMAASFVASQISPGAKALVITTDLARYSLISGSDALPGDGSFGEPSVGAGAVALLVSQRPETFELDLGASGYYGHEVMDTCRPVPDSEAGSSDLSLLSYLDSCEATFSEYAARVRGVDYRSSFDYLAFHTPFAGMVKGAHRTMMRKVAQAAPADIEADFAQRVEPGLRYCQRVGNIMGGTVFLALASTIDHGNFAGARRIGCFSYGSGSCAEFYSGVVTAAGQASLRAANIDHYITERYPLTIEEYSRLLESDVGIAFGTRNKTIDRDVIPGVWQRDVARKRLILNEIREFHRRYEWLE